jgi:hypothetical protein
MPNVFISYSHVNPDQDLASQLPGTLEACVKEQLAVYLGPLARMMADRAAKKAANWRELYDALAGQVPEGEERKKFLSHLPR